MRTLSPITLAWRAGPYYPYDLLVESRDLGVHWSHGTNDAGGYAWEHRLWSVSEIEMTVPPGGGIGVVSSLVVEVVENHSGTSPRMLWDTLERLEGADIQVALLPEDEAYLNRTPLFAGHIEKVEWSNGLARLTAVDDTLHGDMLLPQTLVTPQAFPDAPPESIGRALPLVYGRGMQGRLALAPLLMVAHTATPIYRYAGHSVAGILAVNQPGLWPQHSTRLRVGPTPIIDPVIAQVILPTTVTALFWGGPGSELPLLVGRQLGVQDAANAMDADPASLAVIGTNAGQLNGDGYGYLGIRGQPVQPEGLNSLHVTLQNHRRSPGSTTQVTGQLFVQVVDAGQQLVQAAFTSERFRHVSNPADNLWVIQPFSLDAHHFPELFFQVIREGGSDGPGESYQLGQLTATLAYQPSSPLELLYMNGTLPTEHFNGRADVDGTITGYAGGPIENPADVIRSILVHEMHNTVDVTSFHNARAAFGPLVLDGGLGAGWSVDRMPAREVLDALLRQTGSYLFPSGGGTFKLVRYTPNAASCFDFTQDHILSHTDAHGRPQSSLHVEMSRFELIHNAFTVRYNYHAAKQSYESLAYAFNGGSNAGDAVVSTLIALCVDSTVRYGPLPELAMDAWWVSQSAMAGTLLEHLVTYFWSQHIFVTFETSFVGIHLEVTDFITITHPELPGIESGRLFEIIAIRRSFPREEVPTMRITAMRVLSRRVDGLRLKDQSGTVWRIAVDRSGAPGIFPDTMDMPYPGKVFRIINPGTPQDFIQTLDQLGNTRYIAVRTQGGVVEFLVTPTLPAGTAYTPAVLLIGEDGYLYQISAETSPDGSSTVRVTNTSTTVQGFDLRELATGLTWTLFVNLAGSLQLFLASTPFPLGTPFTRISPVPAPHYLAMRDELGGTQFVRVVTAGGTTQLQVSTTLPSGTAYATDLLEMRGVSLHLYQITARSQSVLQVVEV